MRNVSKKSKIAAGRLLGMGESSVKVASAVGVSRQALSLWRTDPDFQKSFKEAKVAYSAFRDFYVGERLR